MPPQSRHTEAVKQVLLNHRAFRMSREEIYLAHSTHLPHGYLPASRKRVGTILSQFVNHPFNHIVSVGKMNGEEYFMSLDRGAGSRIHRVMKELMFLSINRSMGEYGNIFNVGDLFLILPSSDGDTPWSSDEIRWAARKYISGRRKPEYFRFYPSDPREDDTRFVVDDGITDRRHPFDEGVLRPGKV